MGLCEGTASFPPSSLKLQRTVVRTRSFIQQTTKEHSCAPNITIKLMKWVRNNGIFFPVKYSAVAHMHSHTLTIRNGSLSWRNVPGVGFQAHCDLLLSPSLGHRKGIANAASQSRSKRCSWAGKTSLNHRGL